MIRKFAAAALLCSGLAVVAHPAKAEYEPLTPDQAEAVRKVVRGYLMEHPEVIVEAMEGLRQKMMAQQDAEAKQALKAYSDELFNSKDDPVSGNPNGDVTLVEFFDYNCGYCKLVMDPMWDAAKADKNVKIVFKEFPILTESSETAARVALAAKKQNKYDEVHRALMKYRGKLDDKSIMRLAGEAGANVKQIEKEMMAPEIDAIIKKNTELAHALGITATPSFVIGDRILSGARDAQSFSQLFKVVREAQRSEGGK